MNEVIVISPSAPASLAQTLKSGNGLYPVEVVEGRPELIHLLLTDALGVAGQDLGLDLIDGASDGCEEQLPPHTDMLLMWRHRAA